ncbi:MAG: hypothetical protein ABI321_06995 [Polyangia bacterium]
MNTAKLGLFFLVLPIGACGSSGSRVQTAHDLAGFFSPDSGQVSTADGAVTSGDGSAATTYVVYAHSDHVLYQIDLAAKQLTEVGPFKAPKVGTSEDVITDLAVAPTGTLYVVSKSTLYTADPSDGHVTSIGKLSACGSDTVALTTTPDGNLYAGDHQGAFCKIDLSASPPTVLQVGTLGGGLALSGDLVAVGDGTMYGSADKIGGSTKNDLLVTIDPSTGSVIKTIGSSGYPQLYGVAFAMGQVFGFTHDGSGDVVTIDPKTGVGTLFNSFNDSSGKPISFAGAGVNSMVAPTIN